MHRLLLLLLGLISLQFVEAQDISGIWRGKLVMGAGGCFPVYQIELQFTVTGNQIKGKASEKIEETLGYVDDLELIGRDNLALND